MTVNYNLDVSSASIFSFLRLQLRWKGSIWKYLLKELFMFIIAFITVSSVYRSNLIIGEKTRKIWDNFAALFDQNMDFIPLTFMLGFFVTIIVRRWNDIFANLGWVENTAITVANYIRGTDDRTRMIRRNVIRYMVLAQVLVFRDCSIQVRKRFPTMESIVSAGFMLEHEKEALDNVQCGKLQKYFVPIQWSTGLLVDARAEGKIAADLLMNEIGKHIIEFRKMLALLSNYDWVPIPLAYPQVVFLAVRSYFFMALIARQSVLLDGKEPEQPSILYPTVPFVMSILQFIFVVGWMKVAESMINPLGEDDDDFECNYLLDRNLMIGLCIVDDNYNRTPSVEKDAFWCADVEPLYSVETAMIPKNPQIGSAANYDVKVDEEEVMMMPHMDDVDLFDFESTNNLIPRKTFSVISIQRPFGSRASLASRKRSMMFDQLRGRIAKKQHRSNMFQNSVSQASLHYFESQAPSEINLSTLEMTAPKRKSSTGKLGSMNVAEEQHKLSAEVLPIVIEEDEERSKMLEKDKNKNA
ncbi:Bestrophin homolog 15 [Caenorhabditis elegans]|uniref:Bestrophin homolog 15 n=1 Tax=Caenorhabditis elegans TaxID=6239 RepID=BST15_CAEEL|nr:Bestrophin homolog 15 [Caenorhabditis elegans]Q21973.2 RecName: Full=Bestrophin homolog 15; AltName: Full=Bestrophin-1; Short=ceBest1 [Caenorhabditis elegans]AAR99658.1 bestrophin 1 [Caenorhabditis elegans]CAA97442.2 Bestrophin homolog 15 [Caenorhabditis elegans]|eukprot:NP_502007.2 Bestrophin homolog 15 [Caenorhabditis elegans]